MSDTVIRVENLGKRYRIGLKEKGAKSLKEQTKEVFTSPFKYLNTVLRDPSPDEIFWALKDVSFEVKRGEVLGVIGRNGAGKSTLLKILSRITEPTKGFVEIRGRVGSLLEVGTGFHPDLTGRENTYLNGTIMGMKKREIDRRFDEIVDFAEVEKFIDTPVKHYSSGMYTRLAFAVAAHLEPEILIVDEVLSVGDSQFQKKCLGKIKNVSSGGRTVLFVSHSMPTITSLCSDVILLSKGNVINRGAASEVIMQYYNSGESSPASVIISEEERDVGDEYVRMISGCIKNSFDEITPEISINENAKVILKYRILMDCNYKFVPNFHFYTAEGYCAFVTAIQEVLILPSGEYEAECLIPMKFLNEGAYFIGLAISSFESGVKVHFFEQNILSFNVKDPLKTSTPCREHGYTGTIPGVVRPQLEWKLVQTK